MIKIIDYISFKQPDILEVLMRVGFCMVGRIDLASGQELTPEQEYLDKLMRQRPRPGAVRSRYYY